MKCVKCGELATDGSAKHPYCKKHFLERWDIPEAFFLWLEGTHHLGSLYHNEGGP